MTPMSDLANRPPRAVRERRANRLVAVGGTAAVVAVVGFVLSIAGVIGATVPLLAAIVAVVSGLLFRQLIRPR